MSYLKFNHVFVGLMFLALLSAFVLPPQLGDRLKSPLMGVFAPVSYPVGKLGRTIRNRISPPVTRDIVSPANPRDIETLRLENQQLHNQVLSLKSNLDLLIEREDARARLGDLRDRCTPMSVIATDTAQRDSLILGGTSFSGLRDGMPVIYPGGIVGRLSAVGVGGARVTLITDPSSRFIGTFTRAVHEPNGTISYPSLGIEPRLIEGRGQGMMTARITEAERAKAELRKDDWVILADNDWPRELRNFLIGFVAAIEPTRDPGFLLITIRPDQDLKKLQEVMVMNKE